MRYLVHVLLILMLALPLGTTATAQDAETAEPDRSATGGATTLEDILARQRGEKVDDSYRSDNIGDPDSAAGIAQQLGTLGGASDPELWRALRYNEADVKVSAGGDVAKVLVQDGGMRWYEFREGPLATYGGWLLLGTIAFLALFLLLRGRIRIDAGKTGHTVTRFAGFERFSHWLLAGSFILLALTGLCTLFGRMFIAPYIGKEFNATLLTYSKYIHNNVSWAFMVGLVLVFVLWVWHNIPNRLDLIWFKQAGGIIGKSHPPAKKFNAGQKIIFWSVILLGTSIAVSGLSLLFPFELQLFAKTFSVINDLGLPGLVGYDPLPTALAPQEEMQLAQLWHAIVSFVLMAIILAHIYIGSVGMEGAFEAMGSGEVDENWAEQHHSIWYEELKEKNEATAPKTASKTAPAE
ncbi:formate dehydrogenase subunit gamma [Roseovarius indicus]|uniref:Formate dehydrogenase n=1 Tax=Roseovarius indicus TaxID=540747 RepID=A0A0T5P4R1_9RHOB|nr:formate dehydrogenase subunit gamma [Roseovarius indicus]KRS16123.1 formate dehydrogenase [Roseovarius indicus]QEW24958.1 Formate dehydrogenase-O subunit gamma [Roseovarius indicus]SFE41327.1 formate dehydrogenase subunit gamma [Roseovarius indicus]